MRLLLMRPIKERSKRRQQVAFEVTKYFVETELCEWPEADQSDQR